MSVPFCAVYRLNFARLVTDLKCLFISTVFLIQNVIIEAIICCIFEYEYMLFISSLANGKLEENNGKNSHGQKLKKTHIINN